MRARGGDQEESRRTQGMNQLFSIFLFGPDPGWIFKEILRNMPSLTWGWSEILSMVPIV